MCRQNGFTAVAKLSFIDQRSCTSLLPLEAIPLLTNFLWDRLSKHIKPKMTYVIKEKLNMEVHRKKPHASSFTRGKREAFLYMNVSIEYQSLYTISVASFLVKLGISWPFFK